MKTDTTYRYYYCKTKGHTKSITADQLEDLCMQAFLASYADVEVTEPVVIPPNDPSEQIAEAELAAQNLTQQLAKAKTDTMRGIIESELELWESKLAHLESIPKTAGGIEHVPTGRTWKQELESTDDEGRRLLWHRVGFRFAARSSHEDFTLAIQPPALTEMWETFNEHQKEALREYFREHPKGIDFALLTEQLPAILHQKLPVR